MEVTLDLIRGVSVGIEYLGSDEGYNHTVIVDAFLIRLLIQWS